MGIIQQQILFRTLTYPFRTLQMYFRTFTYPFRTLQMHFRTFTDPFRTLTPPFRTLTDPFRTLTYLSALGLQGICRLTKGYFMSVMY